MEAGVLAPWVPLEQAVKGKLIFLPRVTTYEQNVVNSLVEYVKGGGTLVMCADAGRHIPEASEADWVLLKQLGFTPPAEAKANDNYATAVPADRTVFSAETKAFRFREVWSAKPGPDEQLLAVFQGDARRAAITAKAVGKGRAVVVWASTLVPAGQESDPFLRDLARWAGVTIHAEGTPASFWTNLVQDSARNRYYGLVYCSGFPGNGKAPAIEGEARWFLPTGSYQITELIQGRDLGVFTAAALMKGISAKLNPYEVAIYRIEKVPAQ
jgi:hypothetical protein